MLFTIHFLLNDFHFLTQFIGQEEPTGQTETDYLELVALYQRRGWTLRENAGSITTLEVSVEEEISWIHGLHYPLTTTISPELAQNLLSFYEAA